MEELSRLLLGDVFSQKRIGAKKSEFRPLSLEMISEYAADLKLSAESYFHLSTPSATKYSDEEKMWLERIGRLRGYAPSSLLLCVYSKKISAKERVSYLQAFERFQFAMTFGGATHSMRLRHSMGSDWIQDITTDKLKVSELTTIFDNIVSETFKETSLVDLLTDWVRAGPSYYGWRSLKYFLFEYECSLMDRSKTNREKLSWTSFAKEDFGFDYETIEHIYPQKGRDEYWRERFEKFTTAQRRALRNSLGNLVALSRPRNSSLSNKAFPTKRDEPNLGYRVGSYSEIEVASYSDWDSRSILKRGCDMLDFLQKRWRFSVGDHDSQKKALGLQFLASNA